MANELNEIASGVACLPAGGANVYFVGDRGSDWIVVDSGVSGKARVIREAAASRFGSDTKPACILLTHGHMDHAGSAQDLANLWDIPIYAHRLELPYLTGKSVYPPSDPTAPGFLAFMARFLPPQGFDFGDRVRPLEEGKFPALTGWRWLHTPGHAPGHASFFRASDATLLAGDAFATVNLDSAFDVLRKKQRVSRPPTPTTCDWLAAAASVKKLDALNPLTFGCGHGVPMSGADAADELAYFADHFPFPSHGRYVHHPAKTDESGVVQLPPPPPDKAPGVAGALGIATISGVMFAIAAQHRRKKLLQGH